MLSARKVQATTRILLLDTTAYQPSTPLFLSGLQDLAARDPEGYNFTFIDEASFARAGSSIVSRAMRRVLCRSACDQQALNRSLIEHALAFKPTVTLICKGTYVYPETLRRIKSDTGALLVNYATDDPFNERVNTSELVSSIPIYDLYACTKRAIMNDISSAGCGKVIFMPFAYKPEVHFPEAFPTRDLERFACDVAFVGGCDRDRSTFFTELLRRMPRLNLRLYGGFWNRQPLLRRYWHGFAVGCDYRMALRGAKVALNLIRRANRDGHVMRSFEIPACGAFMLADRTADHLELFHEGREAAYFGSLGELVEQINYYLTHDRERKSVAKQGQLKVTTGSHTYLDRLRTLLSLTGCMHERS
jgi:spore maturation protein CgeB